MWRLAMANTLNPNKSEKNKKIHQTKKNTSYHCFLGLPLKLLKHIFMNLNKTEIA